MCVMLARSVAVIVSATALVVTGAASASNALRTDSVVNVPCSTVALASAIADASDGEVLSLAGLCTYRLAAGLPPIRASLTIRGNQATIERSQAPGTPDFTMLVVAFFFDVTISNLSFRHAQADEQAAAGAIENNGDLTVIGGSFGSRYGAAIENGGTLTVTGASFSGNLAADGGAIANLSVAHIANSSFRNNRATFNGGAFHNEGQATFRNSQFAGNSAVSFGGGIFNGIEGNAATITRGTFRGNQAAAGGGIYNEDVVNLMDTLVLDNRSSSQGGGIYTNWVLAVTNSQIIGNSAAAGGGIYDGDSFGSPGSVTLTRSVVFGNHPDNCEPAGLITSCTSAAPATRLAHRTGHAARARSGTHHLASALARDFHPRGSAGRR